MPVDGTFSAVGKLPDSFVIELNDKGEIAEKSSQKSGLSYTSITPRTPQQTADNKAAARKLFTHIQETYGHGTAQLMVTHLSPQMHDGEQLTAGHVKKILASAGLKVEELAKLGFTPAEVRCAQKYGLNQAQMMRYKAATIPICDATMVRDFEPFHQYGEAVELSGGALNSPLKLDYRPPGAAHRTTYVFKKETKSGLGVAGEILGIIPDHARLGARNIATHKLDTALGFGITPRTEMAMHGGELGMVMGFVEGEAGVKRLDAGSPAPPKLVQLYERLVAERDDPHTPPERVDKLKDLIARTHVGKVGNSHVMLEYTEATVEHDMSDPGIRMALTRLHLLDALTAQCDRHRGNFIVQRDAGGAFAGLKAIDNDQCFGPLVTDFTRSIVNQPISLPPVVDTDMETAINSLTPARMRAELAGLLPEPEIDAAIARLGVIQAHIAMLRADNRVIQPNEWGSQRVTTLLAPSNRAIGSQTSYVARELAAQRSAGPMMIDEVR